MSTPTVERVLTVHHWNDTLFSFRTTRQAGLRFENGQFVMVGLAQAEGRPLLRAYSIASPNYAEYLEFFSIKVENGPLTSRLQHLQPGDEVLVGHKPTGTLTLHDLKPGKRVYLLSTGTGLAPFISLIQDPLIYERFQQVILVHGVRRVSDLAYASFIRDELPRNEYFGEAVRAQLLYYPTVTREEFPQRGRITAQIDNGQLSANLGLPPLDPADDRVMLCGSAAMLKDCRALLDARGFRVSRFIGDPGDYVIEHSFVDK
ncbi:ferredoxin--NADP reductase [Rhodocyclus tenuis]|uniref:ferredoxin--NADP(+) reductase n=2 Tax=Rhodocyclus TaxID=1064 RepID=A0A6L5JUP3_RHOTE|nr:ferredoxin--NADP reductase [Rhodocyclus gracilis]MQY51097.1 ferredoxin--NADP reductase [Rhodocyclus gracilis]NJA88807.1 ferredoxin--NADP reductase [Rhodocyclus gracilis]